RDWPDEARQPPIRFWIYDFGFWITTIHKSKIQNLKSKIGKVPIPAVACPSRPWLKDERLGGRASRGAGGFFYESHRDTPTQLLGSGHTLPARSATATGPGACRALRHGRGYRARDQDHAGARRAGDRLHRRLWDGVGLPAQPGGDPTADAGRSRGRQSPAR